MIRKPKVARPVLPNAGTEARYRCQLKSMIAEMQNSIEYWLTATYKAAPPILAQDSSPTRAINKQMRELTNRWQTKFDDMAPTVAESFLRNSFRGADSAMRMALRDVGFTVEFSMTPAMKDAMQASLAENVGLIRTIPQQYLQKVEGIVNRSYMAGRDLHAMVQELHALYPITNDRAVLIARDQANKANAVVTRTRQLELGLTDAIWHHSHAGKTPRPSHVRADGTRYKIAEGCLIDGEYIQPGTEINCRCTARSVIPFQTQ